MYRYGTVDEMVDRTCSGEVYDGSKKEKETL